ncbi:hypothetical protein L195_g064336 [Trifolium pratense]|uniref:Uncharacterized protein n=1 Tax=Trifolium pratense TaxID=57577 RepID=A0A2K3KSF2_TRIPR|nr:hypothetical protein L195_g064336 [Trifolium pratense]
MIDEEMRGRPVTSSWDTEPGYMSWIYRVSHPVMRPVQAPESSRGVNRGGGSKK